MLKKFGAWNIPFLGALLAQTENLGVFNGNLGQYTRLSLGCPMNPSWNQPKLFWHTLEYFVQLFGKFRAFSIPFPGAVLAQTEKLGFFNRNLGQYTHSAH